MRTIGYVPFPEPEHHLILSFQKRAVFFAIGNLQDKDASILGLKSEILIAFTRQRFGRDHEIVSIESELAGLLADQVRGLGNNRGHEGA